VADEAGYEGGGLAIHPMDQFIVKPLFGGDEIHWYTPTNVTLWMGLAVVCVVLLLVMGTRGRAIVPSRAQSIAELAYGFVYKMVEDVAGKDGLKYFPYIMTLFMFIVFANFLGLIPTSFTTTSHIAVTAVMAMGGVPHRHDHGLRQERRGLPQPVLGVVGAAGAAADAGDHRGDFLLRAPGQPLHSSGRQHDGRPRGDQGVRRLRAAIAAVAPLSSAAWWRSTGSRCSWPSSRPTSLPS
jgi:hypothetical protein